MATTPHCFSKPQPLEGREILLCPLHSNIVTWVLQTFIHSFTRTLTAYVCARYYNETEIWLYPQRGTHRALKERGLEIGGLTVIRIGCCGSTEESEAGGKTSLPRGGKAYGEPCQRVRGTQRGMPGAERHIQRDVQGERFLQTSATKKSGVVLGVNGRTWRKVKGLKLWFWEIIIKLSNV